MGRPKQHLDLGGETMLERQLNLLHLAVGSVAILGQPGKLVTSNFPVYADRIPGLGPLGGIYTGLLVTHTEYNLFLSCDLPFMEAAFLRALCTRAIASGADVTVPVGRGGRYEPLCAVYRRRARPAIRASLLRGESKVSHFFSRVCCQAIRPDEIASAGFGRRIFTNVNTPAEYEEARKAVAGGA